MKRKHIYLLPFEIEGKGFITPSTLKSGKQAKRAEDDPLQNELYPDEIRKKRNEIFNNELEAVIGKVVGQDIDGMTQIEKDMDIWLKNNLPDDRTFAICENIYFRKKIYPENIAKVLTEHLKIHEIHSFAVILLNEKSGCYFPVIYNGIDDLTAINLVFTFECEYLQEADGIIKIDNELKENVFFKKKFSPNDLKRFSGIEAIRLNEIGLECYCLLFHESLDAHNKIETSPNLTKEIKNDLLINLITPLIPALNQIHSELNQIQNNDNQLLLINVFNSFRQFIYNGKTKCLIHKINIINFHQIENGSAVKHEVMKALSLVLDRTNVIIENKVDGFILLTRTIEKRDLLTIIQNQNIQYQLETLRFPENGKNLFSYFF